jgi:hypothetical protein
MGWALSVFQTERPCPRLLLLITLSVFRLAARRADPTALILRLESAPVSEKPVGLKRSPGRPRYGR